MQSLENDINKIARGQHDYRSETKVALNELSNKNWTIEKCNASTKPYLVKRLLEAQNHECKFMDELKQVADWVFFVIMLKNYCLIYALFSP